MLFIKLEEVMFMSDSNKFFGKDELKMMMMMMMMMMAIVMMLIIYECIRSMKNESENKRMEINPTE